MTLGCKDIGFRKSEFVAKTQFLYMVSRTSDIYTYHALKQKIENLANYFLKSKASNKYFILLICHENGYR